MHRLLVDPDELERETPALSEGAARHLRVLRPKPGEEIELFDGRGRWRVCAWAQGGLRAAGALRSAPRPRALTLFACVTKGARWDWTVEKATELGVTRIVPVLSDRTIVRVGAGEREAKRVRWAKIAEEAARQSDAKWLPEMVAPVAFDEALRLVVGTHCFVGALSEPPPPTIGEALAREPAPPVEGGLPYAVFVGPEGDFTPDELAALVAVATPVSFGSTILRAETAAIYGVGAVKTHLDRFA